MKDRNGEVRATAILTLVEVEISLLKAMINDAMYTQLVEMEILPGGWCRDAEGENDIS